MELESIKKHKIKNHTILIDDISLLGAICFDFHVLEDIKRLILEINPNCKFFLEDEHVPRDVLVAKMKS